MSPLLLSLLLPQILMASGHNMFSLLHTGLPMLPSATISGRDHHCYRECGDETMTCEYNFTVGMHTSMSLQCKNCPYEIDDCFLPGCITGGGIVRPIVATNGQLPGPAIHVCENDRVVVNVMNALNTASITVHWHGISQRNSPYSDGVPYVTQCPIEPYTSFRYEFPASPQGTHVWHGHSGYQEADGLFGALIVRRKESTKVRSLYDFDLPEHTVLLWHWFDKQASVVLPTAFHTGEDITGYALLVNGKGTIKKFTDPANPGKILTTPREKFYVNQGSRYRFRMVFNSAVYCPVQVSVDNHTLTAIASEVSTFEPVEVDSIAITAGERYDFVLNANQDKSCYYMRFRGFGDCEVGSARVHEEALLCYNGAFESNSDESSPTNYEDGRREGKLLNPIGMSTIDYSQNSVVQLQDLESSRNENNGGDDCSRKPDVVLYLALRSHNFSGFDILNNFYTWKSGCDWLPYPGTWYQLNNVSFEMPGRVLLTERFQPMNDDNICTDETVHKHCINDFCSCRYLNQVPLNSLVEIVLVDVTPNGTDDHPMHLHGYQFHVVAMEALHRDVSVNEIKMRNEKGDIRKNLRSAVAKDTVTVPARGYVVLRFIADNPGYWIFHCHLTKHVDLGMAMVLQVGTENDMAPLPKHVRSCTPGNIPVQDAMDIYT